MFKLDFLIACKYLKLTQNKKDYDVFLMVYIDFFFYFHCFYHLVVGINQVMVLQEQKLILILEILSNSSRSPFRDQVDHIFPTCLDCIDSLENGPTL